MMVKIPTSLLVLSSFWFSIFAPFVRAQHRSAPVKPEAKGLHFRIREEAGALAKPKDDVPVAAEPLSVAETNEIFRRLPPMPIDTPDDRDVALRPGSLPPPKTGNVIPIKFPADVQAAPLSAPATGDLELLRFSPAGGVLIAPELSVTFSQPMVAVGSQIQAAGIMPVEISPAVKGKWRWLGTQTLVCDPETRFPMATEFTVTVPRGTRSENGGTLAADRTWTFSTPPPKVTTFLPSNTIAGPDAICLAVFDQAIDRDAVLKKIAVTALVTTSPVRLATDAEISADESISKIIKETQPGRWIAFRTAEKLPLESRIVVTFDEGLPSAEGPIVTTTSQKFGFDTYPGLRFKQSHCGWKPDESDCVSSQDWKIEFNNPLAEESLDPSKIRIEPKLENAKISVSDNTIEIQSYSKKSRTSYRVVIPAGLKDVYGQTLASETVTGFTVRPDDPSVTTEGDDIVTLAPNGKPAYSVYSTNYPSLHVQLFAVRPQDFKAFRDFQKSEEKAPVPKIGKLIFDKQVPTHSTLDNTEETKIDISPAFKAGFGHALLVIKTHNEDNEQLVRWIQRTNIGVDAVQDQERLSVFASDLRSGKPLGGVRIELPNGEASATADNGLGDLALPPKDKSVGDWLVARHGSDSAILFGDDNRYETSPWVASPDADSLRWFVFDDRKMYRPEEEVSIKGYIRKVTGGKFADIAELGEAVKSVNYVLKDPLGNTIATSSAAINAFGAFDLRLRLPKETNLGHQKLTLTAVSSLDGSEYEHSFQVQEFRRPEFEVSAKVESSAPFYVGGSASISTEAKYYSGGFLSMADTKWVVTATPTNYTPPNRDDFTFGTFVPWWRESGVDYDETTSQKFEGKTGLNGRHTITLDFDAANPARPYTVTAEAKVQDVNRQTFAASTTLLVHPSTLYVGVRTPKLFVNAGDRLPIETITTDVDGNAVAGALVSVSAELKDWQKVKGTWEQVTIETKTCELRSAADAVACEITATQGGLYTIKTSVSDDRGRRNESELTVWVAGGKSEPANTIEEETVELIPDKKEYSPNDTAGILVSSPFSPAEGVMTLERNGIVRTERFTMAGSSTVLRIPIEERFLPNIHVRVDLTGTAERVLYDDARDAKVPRRPAFASGELNLSISTDSRKLTVTAEPAEKTLEPGGGTKINIEVRDNAGNPAPNTEVAVIAVDESVLALTKYRIEHPLPKFYRELDANASSYHSRKNVLLSYPGDINIGFGSGNGTGDGYDGSIMSMRSDSPMLRTAKISSIDESPIRPPKSSDEIRLRQNFNALAIFSPSVITDTNGKAVVDLKLPDNLTRYRITAVAATRSKQFGLGESTVTAKQSLQVRPSAPRFLNLGDRAELPVVLQNQTDLPMTVNVAIRASNLEFTSGNGRKLMIAANGRAEIRFPVTTAKTGTTLIQIGAVSGRFGDAAEVQLPVYTPATTEAFATYGTTDANGPVVQSIAAPRDVYSEFGGLEVTTSSTQLQELTDAFIYLQSYPFECSEQISSRVLSVAAVRDVLTAFKAKDMPSTAAIEAKMKSDIARLQKLQHKDGGFSFWRRDDESLQYLSVHVAHALARARQKGYAVPPEMITGSLKYLRYIDGHESHYSRKSRWAISAYALYVRDLLGDRDAGAAHQLLSSATPEKLSPEANGWLMAVLVGNGAFADDVQLIERNLLNRVTETAGGAHFVTDYSDGEYVLLSSNLRSDGVILEALLKADPKNDLIPKLVRGLLAGKVRGRWRSTQENAFVLLALDKYFQTYEKVTPNFVARVWLGNAFAGEQAFSGRSVDSDSLSIPMSYLQTSAPVQNLIIDRQGDGRLYYRVGMKYALKIGGQLAADYGFAVSRTYEAIDDPADVRQNADGSWTIRSGARVRVNVQMVTGSERYHVALVDNLPAGIEIIDPELAVTGSTYVPSPDEKRYGSSWVEHQNLRDNRAEAFTTRLPTGVWFYSYTARATTPGAFVAAPAKAEEMYTPETFGRSRSDVVRID